MKFKPWSDPPDEDRQILIKTDKGFNVVKWNPDMGVYVVSNPHCDWCPICAGYSSVDDEHIQEWCYL